MNLLALFQDKAEFVSCKIFSCNTLEESFPYILQVAIEKPACELLDSENVAQGDLSENNLPTRLNPLLAVPDLSEEEFKLFHALCQEKGCDCVRSKLRNHLAGIDIGVTKAKLGIAQTGSCLIDTTNDDIRLATMISEIHVIVLKKSTIKANLVDACEDLKSIMNTQASSNTLFVTGPSRTSDIERIAAVGVHGPLEVHIILLEA